MGLRALLSGQGWLMVKLETGHGDHAILHALAVGGVVPCERCTTGRDKACIYQHLRVVDRPEAFPLAGVATLGGGGSAVLHLLVRRTMATRHTRGTPGRRTEAHLGMIRGHEQGEGQHQNKGQHSTTNGG